LIAQNKQAFERMINEFNLQSGFVGVKQYQNDWTLRKKEVMTDMQKILNEKLASQNNQIYDLVDRLEASDKCNGKIMAKLNKLLSEKDRMEEVIDRKMQAAIDKSLANYSIGLKEKLGAINTRIDGLFEPIKQQLLDMKSESQGYAR
jgi:seryl-tRNA synthetase